MSDPCSSDPAIDLMRAAILRAFPDLAGATFRLMPRGWDAVAVDVDDRLIFKFPRSPAAERRLRMEAAMLVVIRPRVSIAVPDMTLHEGPPLFSRHPKLPGAHLLPSDYASLPEPARRRLGDDLGRFYAELHRLEGTRMTALGAQPVGPWQTPDVVRARAMAMLPEHLRAFAEQAVSAFADLVPDPHGTTYGFFDGHGWNMAFDHEEGRLNGIYDFGDSGIGPLHQEFIYSNLTSADLTARIVARYEALTGRGLDRHRIDTLMAYHRLSQLAEHADDSQHAPTMIRSVEAWADQSR